MHDGFCADHGCTKGCTNGLMTQADAKQRDGPGHLGHGLNERHRDARLGWAAGPR